VLVDAGLPSGSAPDAVTKFVSIGGSVGPIPVPWLVPSFIVLTVLVIVVLNRTPYGRRLFALGANPRATAALALVSPLRMWVVTYAISAFFAATAGVCYWASPARPTATSASPTCSRPSPR
jgi:ribose transport system permease protein